jgi:transcription antitermination factor NusG
MMSKGKKWYVIYTKPRWEKKVHAHLISLGVESYCPLNKVRKQWSDRIKLVEEPLFKSYVFVRVMEEDQGLVRATNGVLNFVYMEGRPAIVRDNEIANIKRFLNEYQDVKVVPIELKPNNKVLISGGVLMDKEATVIRVLKHSVELSIETLGYKMIAKIHKKNILPIP